MKTRSPGSNLLDRSVQQTKKDRRAAVEVEKSCRLSTPGLEASYLSIVMLLTLRHSFQTLEICNVDDTSVHVSRNILCQKGKKQIGAVTSAEREEMVTLVCTIKTSRKLFLQYFILPEQDIKIVLSQVHRQDYLV